MKDHFCAKIDLLATPGGFEPPISTVTGWHVSPLHHGATLAHQAYEVSSLCAIWQKSISGGIECQATVKTLTTGIHC